MAKVFGIVFKYLSRHFKLVDIEWGTDNSFYFLPYRHEAEIGTRLKTRVDEFGRIILNVHEIETTNFPAKKISRHPSGFFHIKDVEGSGGNREKDGLRGPAFKETDGFYVFLVACPQSIEKLVEVQKPDLTDIIAELPDGIEPFTVQFAVWNKNVRVSMPLSPGKYLGNGAITVTNENLEYGMVIMFVNVENTTPEHEAEFPARTCYIVR